MSNADYSTADIAENHVSYKTKSVAARKAVEWALLNGVVDLDHAPALGEVFETTLWNGSYHLPVWLAYDISATDEGWTVTSYRWNSDPRQAECHAARTGEGYWTCDVPGGCSDCRTLAAEVEDTETFA